MDYRDILEKQVEMLQQREDELQNDVTLTPVEKVEYSIKLAAQISYLIEQLRLPL